MQKISAVGVKTSMLVLLCGASLVLPFFSGAESYAFYVDRGAKKDGDGSKDDPFREIADALAKAGSGDRIFVHKGSYKGGFVIPKNVGIVGAEKSNVSIAGTIIASDGVMLENISVSGGSTAVLLKKNARVTISKSIIRDAARIGIDVPPGNGKLVVKNSKIHGNGKGFYVQAGNQFQLTGSSVYKNREEGVDLRNNNDGFIRDSEIYENGESGIEIILGKTDMLISGNSIKNNRASGIATQYYAAFDDDGELTIKGNNIKNNNHYGLKCGTPSGGSPSKTYWGDSIALEKNEFDGNDGGDIAGKCRILTDAEKAEMERAAAEKASATKEALKIKQDQLDEQAAAEQEENDRKAREEADLEIKQEAQSIAGTLEELRVEMDGIFALWEARNRFSYWLSGPGDKNVQRAESCIDSAKLQIGLLREISLQVQTDEIRLDIESLVASFEGYIADKVGDFEARRKELDFWYRTINFFA